MPRSIPTIPLGTAWDGEAIGGTAQCPVPLTLQGPPGALWALGQCSSSADSSPEPDPGLPRSTLARHGLFPCRQGRLQKPHLVLGEVPLLLSLGFALPVSDPLLYPWLPQ